MVLRLAGRCRDLPAQVPDFLDRKIFRTLIHIGWLRYAASETSIRLTEEGRRVLLSQGFDYPQDKQSLGNGIALQRRVQSAAVLLMAQCAGADVFLEEVPQHDAGTGYLPAQVLRGGHQSNLLGSCGMTGFLYTSQTVFVPYVLRGGLYPSAEQRVFTTRYLTGGRNPAVIYTGRDGYEELLSDLFRITVPEGPKHTASDYQESMRYFNCPVFLIPVSEAGVRQLRILCVPSCREKAAKSILRGEYRPAGNVWCDALYNPAGEPLVIGFDFDLKRVGAAIRSSPEKRVHIAVLEGQEKALLRYLRGRRAVLHPYPVEDIERMLGLSPVLNPGWKEPYRNAEGRYLDFAFI